MVAIKECQAKNKALCVDPKCPERVFHQKESVQARTKVNEATKKYNQSFVTFIPDAYDDYMKATNEYDATVEGITVLKVQSANSGDDSLQKDLWENRLWRAQQTFAEKYYGGDRKKSEEALNRFSVPLDETASRTAKERPLMFEMPAQHIIDGVNEGETGSVVSPKVPKLGEVWDEVEVDGTVYHRRREGVFPGEPQSMRFQFNREISDEEMQKAAGAIGYDYRITVAGESMNNPQRDTPFSFIMGADTTKTRRDDLGDAMYNFEEKLEGYIKNGSPVRKTNQAGAGTKGTSLAQGIGEDVEVEIYYDNVFVPKGKW